MTATLAEALEEVEFLTDQRPELAVVDRGYRGHGVETFQDLLAGSKRGPKPVLKKLLRQRSAIEPEIGYMMTDGRLARCPLKGLCADVIFTALCGCGRNIRKILNHIRKLFAVLLAVIANALFATVRITIENRHQVQTALA